MPSISELQTAQSAAIAAIQRAVAGEKLTADETAAATDLLAGLAPMIAADEHFVYRIEAAAQGVRLRNAAPAPEAPSPA